ncbi:hypothetical protein ES708_02737 [subsurface metagenome]
MKPLAKGYRRIVDKFGTPWIVREFYYCAEKDAPAECFADAKPAEGPRVEERTLRSPDGAFVMKVWLEDSPPRIEAQIVQQPEGWRKIRPIDPIIRVIEQADGRFWAKSSALPALNLDGLFLRGYEVGSDNCQMQCDFMLLANRDAYLAKLEATVAAMPRLADQFKVEDRVVVAGSARHQGMTSDDLPEWIGRKGRIECVRLHHAVMHFDDGNEKDNCTWLINLRHEREDERPAEPKPEPLALDSEMIQRRLRDGEPKPPPRKYADGQCVECEPPIPPIVGTVRGATWQIRICGSWAWAYDIQTEWGLRSAFEYECRPCPPPLTDAQRKLLPGDKVSVRGKRLDAKGKPIDAFSPTEIFTITVMSLLPGQKCTEVDLESPGDDFHTYLHNLDLVEGGGA